MPEENATPPCTIELIGEPVVIADNALYCAFTDVARLKDGALLAVYFAGESHVDPNSCIELRRSGDRGLTWSAPECVVPRKPGESNRDPHIIQIENGDLLLNYYFAKGENIRSWVLRSVNAGKTWSPPAAVETPFVSTATCGRIFQADNGDLLLPVYGRKRNDAKDEAGLVRSSDGGHAWISFTPVASAQDMDCNEMEMAKLADGSLVALVRRDGARTGLRTVSNDGGRTWSDAVPCECGKSPGLMADGNLLLLNHRGPPPPGKDYRNSSTVISVSLDGGQTFAANRALGPAAGGDCAYGGIVKLPGGAPARYFTTYYAPDHGKVKVFGQFFNVC